MISIISLDSTRLVKKLYRYQKDDTLFPEKAHMALIDDDPVFQCIMSHQADLEHVNLDGLLSFDQRRDAQLLKQADIIILDYELAGTDAPHLIADFQKLAIGVPILVISHNPRHSASLAQFKNVRAFMPKSAGYAAIFDAAEKICREKVIEFQEA